MNLPKAVPRIFTLTFFVVLSGCVSYDPNAFGCEPIQHVVGLP